ncbi:uncharacterized protein LOC128872915 isoform X1 [Hylaeus volcanicus]|uniref:uncharacterized protein LOC128872915 isoform X1 n=1 Tax=Hylaeus volcanicus TaxID=313075 RepID=UPI0023B7AABF|nr:uncharacterized protein LOC128872915 isoform X1 [Hylaeus volcanicus]
MWAPVISILWTIVYMMQRKITMKSIVYSSYSETAGECDQFVGYSIEIITDVAYRPTRKHTGTNNRSKEEYYGRTSNTIALPLAFSSLRYLNFAFVSRVERTPRKIFSLHQPSEMTRILLATGGSVKFEKSNSWKRSHCLPLGWALRVKKNTAAMSVIGQAALLPIAVDAHARISLVRVRCMVVCPFGTTIGTIASYEKWCC